MLPGESRPPILGNRTSLMAGASGAALLIGGVAQFGLSGRLQDVVLQVGLVGLSFTALAISTQRSRQAGPEALGWQIFSLSLLSNVLIQCARIPTFLGHPLPHALQQASIVLQILSSLFLVGSLLSWHLAPKTRFDRIRYGLDGLLFALAVFFILWGLGLGSAFLSDRFPIGARFTWLGTFLVYDLLLGMTVFFGLTEPSRLRGPLGWIAGAFLLASLHNFKWLLDVLSGNPVFHFPAGPLIFAIPLAYLGAALSPRPVGYAPLPGRQTQVAHALPYIPVLGATLLGIWLLITGTDSGHRHILVWLALGLVIVLLSRQYLALRDFSELSRQLETRVAERTRALEEAQAMLLRTERMKSLATLGAGLSHDLNNVLCAIQSRAELVIMDIDEARLPDRKDMVRLQEATQSATTMSRRLMNLGRQEEATPQALDLAGELIAMQPLLQLLLPRNQVLELENVATVTPFLGTKGMLEQILVNLVSNARDAMPSGGRITLRIGVPGPEDGARGPLLEVEDAGTGIPEELQGRLFEPFFTTKPVGKGTGLGLMSVKSLLQKSGGQISFTSQAGRGTTFLVRLPRVP